MTFDLKSFYKYKFSSFKEMHLYATFGAFITKCTIKLNIRLKGLFSLH